MTQILQTQESASNRRPTDMDLNLAVLSVVAPKGVRFTHREIAEIVGCSWQNIYRIEHVALRKIRTKLRREFGLSWDEFFKSATGGERPI